MYINTLLAIVLLPVLSMSAMADTSRREEGNCRSVSFNVACYYKRDGGNDGFEKCQSASQFQKMVTQGGAEIEDKSVPPFNPKFEVQCDERKLFNGSAHRFTDGQGTRLQAEAGPFPASVLPRGSLRDDHKYVPSVLELGEQTLRGFCYIYTGPQLN
jgi:hypothetical protein